MWQWNGWSFGGIRAFWAPDDGGDGGGDPTQNPGNDDGDGAGGDGGSGTIQLTSQQLAERLSRQKRAAVSEFLRGLGFEKADDLKAAIERLKATEDANKTEVQRLQERLAEYEKREQQWAQEKRDTTLQFAVQAAATKLGIVDAEVALALIRGKVEFDDKGQPQGVEAALTELLKEKPYLKAQPAPTGGSPTNPPRNHSSVDDAFTAALYKGAGLKRG